MKNLSNLQFYSSRILRFTLFQAKAVRSSRFWAFEAKKSKRVLIGLRKNIIDFPIFLESYTLSSCSYRSLPTDSTDLLRRETR